MQQIFEPIFHVVYLTIILMLGYKLYKGSQLTNKNTMYFRLFGIMAITLGLGDAFHLIPRIYALLTTGLENNVASLGFGKLVTSITATLFYVLLYKAWKIRFNKSHIHWLNITIITLTLTRIILCFFPQNQWFIESNNSWGIYRNIPFIILGVIIVYLLLLDGLKNKDNDYIQMSIAVFLSFLFYIPVVLFAQDMPLVGMLMIPKTICYVWIVYLAYKEFKYFSRNSLNNNQ